VQRDVSK